MPARIAITGASGYVGQRLVDRLRREASVEYILAMDLSPMPSAGKVLSVVRDVSQPLGGLLADHRIQRVVHLAFVLKPGRNRDAIRRVNVGGLESVLEACTQAGADHLVYLSSTTIYGAHPDNPPLLTEESPLRPNRGFQYAEDKANSEEILNTFARRNPGFGVCTLRGCVVMGPRADNFITQTFKRHTLMALKGHDPPMQFMHEDDLVNVLAGSTLEGTTGTYNVGGDGAVRWTELLDLSRRKYLTLPPALLYPLTDITWRLRLQSESTAVGLDMIRYPWVAGTEKIRRELGVTFEYSSRQAVESFFPREG